MKKALIILAVLIVVGVVGVIVAKLKPDSQYAFGRNDVVLHNPDGSSSYACEGYFTDEEPRVAVWTHLDHPFQRLLTFHIAWTGIDTNAGRYTFTAYTFFGIPLSVVDYDCKAGAIQTIKGL